MAHASSPLSPTQTEATSVETDRLLQTVFELQQQLIQRDSTIHDLHSREALSQEREAKKAAIKQSLSVIEKRHVDTSSLKGVLRDATHHLIYTLSEAFSGTTGLVLLDVPYNSNIGATNADLKIHKPISAYWQDKSMLSQNVLVELEQLSHYRDIITQKRGKIFSDWETATMKATVPILEEVVSLMVAPVVVDGVTIAVIIIANGDGGASDPALVKEVAAELWTSNMQPLINIALETERQKDTESKLATESLLRDEIILSLDTILDDIVKHSLALGSRSTEDLWRLILQRVSDFFEEYFGCDCFVAVTNTEANFRLNNLRHNSSAGGSVVSASHSGRGVGVAATDLAFIHYSFSASLLHTRKTKMKHLSHPKLSEAKQMRRIMQEGAPYFSPDCKGMQFPPGHMKMNNVLLVPIIFCDEPVGMLGMSNGEFDLASGRIMQSVFTTFWSMIVKATRMSESQKVLNAALPVAISERVKHGEEIADSYPTATVLFADIVGFTEFTKELESSEVVEYSNLIFTRLDKLVGDFNLEKIKVIGDCYMVAGGLVDKSGVKCEVTDRVRQSQMAEVCEFGMRIFEEAKSLNETPPPCSAGVAEKLKRYPLQFRVGIAEGPVTAGCFGFSKVQYDILGTTVNLASRLEASGSPGAIHVNSTIYQDLQTKGYTFEKRPAVTLKGLGMQQTYFMTGRDGSYSVTPYASPEGSPTAHTARVKKLSVMSSLSIPKSPKFGSPARRGAEEAG